MPQTTKINWIEARKDYLTDGILSYEDIAKKYGVNLATVAIRASREKWVKLRKQTQLKLQEKTIEKSTDTIANYQAKKFRQGAEIADKAFDVLLDDNTRIGSKTAVEMFSTGHKIQSEALDLDKKDSTREAAPTLVQVNFNFGNE